MNNFTTRLLFALGVGMPLFTFLLWHSYWTRFAALFLLLVLGSWEFTRMLTKKIGGPNLQLFSPILVAIFTILWGLEGWDSYIPLLCVFSLLGYILIAFNPVEVEKIFPWLAHHLFTPVFFGLWGGLSFGLFTKEPGFAGALLFLFVIMLMWAVDSWAYFAGKLFGKTKLCPGISPKKTWEGVVGGVLATIGWAFLTQGMTDLSALPLVGLTLVLCLAGILGDLLMSTLKRYTGAKDSSNIFPGHGGMLDRFDSFYLAGPIAVVLLETFA
jgi:phosphatidate cytidylyltransferase